MRLVIALLFSTAAFANGQVFFAEHPDATRGAPFLGFVKDTKGNPIPGAEVSFTYAKEKETLSTKTDASGYYFFPGFRKEVDPKSIDVSCAKKDYRVVSKVNRPPVGHVTPSSPIEVNFTLGPKGQP
jgi:hypothetical protein